MAIKAGQILHSIHGFVIQRIQTGGVSSLSIPQTLVYELGNFQTVGIIRDTPDLSFDLESVDVSCEIEAILTGQDPTTVVAQQKFDFLNCVPLDVISPFKSSNKTFDILKGIVVPYLTAEKIAYKFDIKNSAATTVTLRGDSVYYVPGTPYYQTFVNTGATTYNFAHTAIKYTESGSDFYAYSVTLLNTSTGVSKRLFLNSDYTNTSSGFTLLVDNSVAYNQIKVTYGSTVAATYGQNLNSGTSVLPAGVRGKDIDVYIGTSAATPVFSRWTGVQTFDVTWGVTLQNDQEFGNSKYVATGYDVSTVTGTIGVQSVDVTDLWNKIADVEGLAHNVTVGPNTFTALPVEVRISDPNSGQVLKTFYIPDAIFTIPSAQGKVQTNLNTNFPFQSVSGVLQVFNGTRLSSEGQLLGEV